MEAYKIYISSTYRDLKEYRGTVKEYLERAQYLTSCMENYPPAFSRSIKEKCEEDVEKANIYLAIIGENYGSIAKDENMAELPYSYTQYEYETALSLKKKRLIFFKTPKEPITDQKLLAFIQRIKDTSSGCCAEFTDAADLSAKVLASIISETSDFKKKIVPIEKKYYCDRKDQYDFFDQYLAAHSQMPVYFFMIRGHKYNGHALLVKRCTYNTRNMFGNRETIDILLMANSTPPSGADKIAEDIKKEIMRQMEAKTKKAVASFSTEGFFECLDKADKKCLSISIVIQSTFLKKHADVYKEAIQKIYADFSKEEQIASTDKKIFFFILVQYHNDMADKDEIVRRFEDQPYFIEKTMPLLYKIDDVVVTSWMLENDIEDNNKEIDNRIKEFFSAVERDEDDAYYMDEAEQSLERVIEYYNAKLNS